MEFPLVPLQERLTEKFHALLGKCDIVAANADFGKTFDHIETFELRQVVVWAWSSINGVVGAYAFGAVIGRVFGNGA